MGAYGAENGYGLPRLLDAGAGLERTAEVRTAKGAKAAVFYPTHS